MKSVANAHVLFLPSWYQTPENPVHGSFFRDQAIAVEKLGVRTGVVFPELKTVEGSKPWEWPGRRYQISEENDAGIFTLRVLGWRIPLAKGLTRDLWRSLCHRLIKQYVRRHGAPDLIHAHCVHQAGVAAMEAKRSWRIPFVITEHFSGYARDLMSDEMAMQSRNVFAHADKVICVSRMLAEDIKPYTSGRDIQIVPNMVDTDFFTVPDSPRQFSPFRFLFVGFLTANKKVDELIRVFAAGFNASSEVRLEIVGDGAQRLELESLAANLGIQDRVDFHGLLPRARVNQLMQRANALVSASEVETFGVVLLEAMSTGMPVIITRCGGPEEFVTPEVGTLVDLGDWPQFQRAMEKMVSGYDHWQNQAHNIRAHVESTFGEQSVGSRIVEAYNSVIQRV